LTNTIQMDERKRRSLINPFDELGKIPPQAIDLEEAVLGAVLLERPAYGRIADIIVPDDFYKDAHVEIFKSVVELSESHTPIDLLLVTQKLREKGKLDYCGGAYYITELTSKVNSAEHIESHALIIKQMSLKRKLIQLSQSLQQKAFDDTEDPFELLQQTASSLTQLDKFTDSVAVESISDIVYEIITSNADKIAGKETKEEGLVTGFPNLDRVVGYWVPQDLIILAARPGMGKSALAISLCYNQATMFNVPCAIFSLEMSSRSLVERFLSKSSELSVRNIRFRKLNEHELEQLIHKGGPVSDYPLYIFDKIFTIQGIKLKARRLVVEHDVRLIVVDYIQLIQAGKIEGRMSSNREQEISYISRELKLLAKELNVPIIALSQLNRSVELRGGDKRPKLSDLRESGSLEQDADIVIFLYRPEYYGVVQDEAGEALTPGYSECIVAKNRNGEIDMASLKFIAKFTSFVNYDRDSFESKIEKAAEP